MENAAGAGSKPSWLKVRLPTEKDFFAVSKTLQRQGLHTICQSARCPNITACWSRRTATFLILGSRCTRACAFCAVTKAAPLPPPADEPARVAEAVADFGLEYAVVTSVTRDDLADGGAGHFAAVIRAIRSRNPKTKVEVLIPDFGGDERALEAVLAERPDILGHNLEVPENIYPLILRPWEHYRRSLQVLDRARARGLITKSGLMLGLGEADEDIRRALADLRNVGCDLLTLGQYLQPGRSQAAVKKYYSPQEFDEWRETALGMGFRGVEAGPLVRSSFQARRLHGGLNPANQEVQ